MPDQFITMVKFQATGLDKIQAGLKAAKDLQTSITTGAKKYTQELKQTTREIETMGRAFRGKEFRDRVRETDTLVRAQERLTKTLERQATLARMTSLAGAAGMAGRGLGMLGNVAGGAAAAGLGMGLAGMSGTVPMARFQNQMDRLQWELGNLLTPYLAIATKATAKAANWLGKQDTGTQNLMGGVLVGGAGLLGANFVSKKLLGMGLGSLGLGVAGLGMQGAGMAFNGIRTAGLATAASANMAYGMGGMAGLGGLAGGAVTGFARRFWPTAVLSGAAEPFFSKFSIQRAERSAGRTGRGDLTGLESFGDEYTQKFAGLSGVGRQTAINAEIANQLKAEQAGIGKMRGNKKGWVAGMLDMALGNMGDASGAREAEERMGILRAMREGKPVPTTKHRANAIVGGDFQEIGAGYYGAMSAAEKLRFDKREGAGASETKDATTILQDILDLIKTFPGMGTPQAQPNKVNLGNAFPNFG